MDVRLKVHMICDGRLFRAGSILPLDQVIEPFRKAKYCERIDQTPEPEPSSQEAKQIRHEEMKKFVRTRIPRTASRRDVDLED